MCIFHIGDHAKGPHQESRKSSFFKQRVETEVEVRSVQFCLYLTADATAEETCLASLQPCVGQLFLLPPVRHCS